MRKPKQTIKSDKLARRIRRKLSIRSKLSGTVDRPRVCVTKSNKHLRVQVVNDSENKVLFSVQTYGKSCVAGAKGNKDGAVLLGKEVASKLKEHKLEVALFDRSGNSYTGVIAALADSIRENGIKI